MSENDQSSKEKKRFTREDVLNASSVGEALHAYRQAASISTPDQISDLQEAVADRAHQLEDEQTSKEFTVLMIQTRNNERFLRGVESVYDLQTSSQRQLSRFEDEVSKLDGLSTRFKDATVSMGDTLSRQVENIVSAAGKMNDAADTMRGAASQIYQSSHRMS